MGPMLKFITKPTEAIGLNELIESEEQFTHNVWIKKFTILLLLKFNDEHLSEVASLQVCFKKIKASAAEFNTNFFFFFWSLGFVRRGHSATIDQSAVEHRRSTIWRRVRRLRPEFFCKTRQGLRRDRQRPNLLQQKSTEIYAERRRVHSSA